MAFKQRQPGSNKFIYTTHCDGNLVRPTQLSQVLDLNCFDGQMLSVNYKFIREIDQIPNHYYKAIKLYFSHNSLTSLKGIERFPNLIQLNLDYNNISKILELKRIQNPNKLKVISLIGTPINQHPDIQSILLRFFPNLIQINGVDVNKQMKADLNDAMALETRILEHYHSMVMLVKNIDEQIEKLGGGKGSIVNLAQYSEVLLRCTAFPVLPNFSAAKVVKPWMLTRIVDTLQQGLQLQIEELDKQQAYENLLYKLELEENTDMANFLKNELRRLTDLDIEDHDKLVRLFYLLAKHEKQEEYFSPYPLQTDIFPEEYYTKAVQAYDYESRLEEIENCNIMYKGFWDAKIINRFPVFSGNQAYLKALMGIFTDQVQTLKSKYQQLIDLGKNTIKQPIQAPKIKQKGRRYKSPESRPNITLQKSSPNQIQSAREHDRSRSTSRKRKALQKTEKIKELPPKVPSIQLSQSPDIAYNDTQVPNSVETSLPNWSPDLMERASDISLNLTTYNTPRIAENIPNSTLEYSNTQILDQDQQKEKQQFKKLLDFYRGKLERQRQQTLLGKVLDGWKQSIKISRGLSSNRRKPYNSAEKNQNPLNKPPKTLQTLTTNDIKAIRHHHHKTKKIFLEKWKGQSNQLQKLQQITVHQLKKLKAKPKKVVRKTKVKTARAMSQMRGKFSQTSSRSSISHTHRHSSPFSCEVCITEKSKTLSKNIATIKKQVKQSKARKSKKTLHLITQLILQNLQIARKRTSKCQKLSEFPCGVKMKRFIIIRDLGCRLCRILVITIIRALIWAFKEQGILQYQRILSETRTPNGLIAINVNQTFIRKQVMSQEHAPGVLVVGYV